MVNAEAAFIESNYGTVAVEYTGEYNQRTFCFSYALADLDDGDFPSTKDELLHRICNFFDIYTESESIEESLAGFKVFPNPCIEHSIIQFSLTESSNVSIHIYSINGQLVTTLLDEEVAVGIREINFDISRLSEGIYFCRLKTREGMQTKKIVKL